ncbi:MAG: DUF1501 domain-containing protein [Planctomycetales bacterium]
MTDYASQHRHPTPFALRRRSFLRFGGVTLAATAAQLLGVRGSAAPSPARDATADQVLFLWLPGGVTHHESFDPKPEAPEEVRGPIQAIETNVPGIRFAEVLPSLARHMDKIALIRSYAAGTNDHFEGQAYALSGRTVLPGGILSEPNFGCVIHHQLGATGGLPGYIAVPGSTRPGPPDTDMFVPAYLGQQFAPFCTMGEPRKPDFQVRDLGFPEGVSADRFQRRQTLREQVEGLLASSERAARQSGMEQLYGRAAELLTSHKVRQAFDLRQERDEARQKYGMSKIGQRCLLARRLIDADARFVMVDYGYDWGEYNNLWDNHCAPVQNQPHIWKMCKVPYHLPAVDQAFAALLEDLAQSGRLARTLVVYFTEFGRTPKINPEGGRDHWGYSGSIFFAGGGVQGGQVLGATDAIGGYCRTRTYSPADAVATVYRALGVDPHALLIDRQSRPVAIQTAGEPIAVF